MTIDYTRRSHLVGLLVQQQRWDLEILQQRNSAAAQALSAADKAVKALAVEINRIENALRRAISGAPNVDLTAIQATQHYLAEQYNNYKQYQFQHKRAAQRAENAKRQLQHQLLTIKALERVKENADQIIIREQEKHLLEQNMALWMQQAVQKGQAK